MRKTLIALMVALTAASATAGPAEARRGFRLGVGVGLLLGGAALLHHRHHHHREYGRPVYIQRPAGLPVQQQPIVQQPQQPVAQQPVARTADDLGRTYDVASKSWFDGKDRCWSGAQAWSFQGGSWFYGQGAWYESSGQWITNAANPPNQVDCASIPVFAARMARGPDKTVTVLTPATVEHGPPPRDVDRSSPPPAEADSPPPPSMSNGANYGGDVVAR